MRAKLRELRNPSRQVFGEQLRVRIGQLRGLLEKLEQKERPLLLAVMDKRDLKRIILNRSSTPLESRDAAAALVDVELQPLEVLLRNTTSVRKNAQLHLDLARSALTRLEEQEENLLSQISQLQQSAAGHPVEYRSDQAATK